MRSDSTLRPGKPSRGLILSTGEDLPRGQSLRARMLTVELDPDGLDWKKLTGAQTDADSGLYAQATAGYLRWLAPRYTQIAAQLPSEVARLRAAAATASGTHRRTPVIVAELAAAAGYFLNYAHQTGAITQPQADKLWHRTWQALNQAAAAQHRHHTAADPARRFLELLTAAIASGRAHLTTADGQQPPNPGAWGWHQTTTTSGRRGRREWRPQGDKIGWLKEGKLYLEPAGPPQESWPALPLPTRLAPGLGKRGGEPPPATDTPSLHTQQRLPRGGRIVRPETASPDT